MFYLYQYLDLYNVKPPVSWAEDGEAGLTEVNAAPVAWLVGRGLFCGQNIVLYSVSYMVDIPAWDCQVFFNIRASIVGCRYVPFSRTCKSMVDDYPMTYHVFILEPRKKRTPKP